MSIPHCAITNDRIDALIKELTAIDSNDHVDAIIKDLTVSDANGPSNNNATARPITDPASRTITKPIPGLANISAFSITNKVAVARPIPSTAVRTITPKIGALTNSDIATNAIARINDHLHGTKGLMGVTPVQSPTSITARLSPIGNDHHRHHL